MSTTQQQQPFSNLIFNILLPVVILNKGSQWFPFSETVLLLVALSFPVTYGLYEWFQYKTKNWLSVFGTLNVLFTGGLALLKVEGIWFAVKEAAFPALIGVFVWASSLTKKPFFKYLIQSSGAFNWPLITSHLRPEQQNMLTGLFKKYTQMFSLSFFLSAVLNFFLALYIFSQESPAGVPVAEDLNQKIADITWLGFVVIGLPMTVIAVTIFWFFIKKLSHITGLSTEQILLMKNK